VSPPINGVATSITAFIGRALRGPTDMPGSLNSFADFQRLYGGLWALSTLGYAVNQFFLNGGSQALIVRIHNRAATAKASAPAGGINLIAANPGAWGNGLRARVDLAIPPSRLGGPANDRFNLRMKDLTTGTIETFENLSTDPDNESFVPSVLAAQSQLVRGDGPVPANAPPANAAPAAGADPFADPTATRFSGGGDGGDIADAQISDPGLQPHRGGLWMLEQADLFNLLCIPPLKRSKGDVGRQTWDAAVVYAKSRRAFVIIDPAERWATVNDVLDTATGITSVATISDNAAIYFPRVLLPDPLNSEQTASFAPGGTIAGIFAETDAQRGVWRAPAGIEAVMQGVSGFSLGGGAGALTDADSGLLNPQGINSLRNFSAIGNVVWGARTLKGADVLASEWKYIPIRRLALYIEESISRGIRWSIFEPNAEPLWAQIRSDISAFMQMLFVQGALQGTTSAQAFFVNCDRTTTTPTDVDNGVMNILIGMAPIRPAEFVIIRIQQIFPPAN
jgi:phage tail sheath protein FI